MNKYNLLFQNNISYQHTDPYNDVQQATNSNQVDSSNLYTSILNKNM